ncbi:glycoside hydrolase family 172 protein [Actinopolymorpha sp. B9G3]|uniref:glycoside hydrolase family 172 protein n=1 Tax=Actinopolymorpha sp. B9G3 TaxID=3158970 RepID=UPI0032D976C2
MLYELKDLRSRAATAENRTAAPGAGGQAGGGRKGSPCLSPLARGATATLLDHTGPGVVRHIWCTIPPGNVDHLRNTILRMYWDGQAHPSVEVPLGDFFGVAHGRQVEMGSTLLSMQGGKGFNCWIPMPFREHARITVENESGSDVPMFFYQVDFTVGDDLDETAGAFHAQFRRSNPCPLHQDFVILDGVEGRGVYLGTVLGVRSIYRDCWWGEGEVKFFLDDDREHPTICGTGAEDYMGSAWGLGRVSTPYQGAPLVDGDTGLYSIYRLHVADPIHFRQRLAVTIQQIGYGDYEKAREHFGDDFTGYRAAGAPDGDPRGMFDLSDDYCSVAYWYQSLPSRPFPTLPDRAARLADLAPVGADAPARSDA